MVSEDKGGETSSSKNPSLLSRLPTVIVAGIGMALGLPAVLGVCGTIGWLVRGMLVRGATTTALEWLAYLIVVWGLLIGACVFSARLLGLTIEAFTAEHRRAALTLGRAITSGAIAGAFVAGMIRVSLRDGQPDVPDKVPVFYWLWGPGLAVVAGVGALMRGKNDER